MSRKEKIKFFLEGILDRFPLLFDFCRSVRNLPRYLPFIKEFRSFKKASDSSRFKIRWRDFYPCLNDRTSITPFSRHYVFHPAWAARILANTMPEEHVDISSSLRFVTVVSAFINTRFYDYRPAELNLNGLKSGTADLLDLSFPDMSVMSLSCMHVIEHIGLGRYGDPLDANGDLKAISELKRVLAKEGNLLFVVPIGKPKIMFNAHRIYSYEQIISYFEELKLMEFALIPDIAEDGGLIVQATKDMADAQTYGCGCFWFKRK